MKDKLIRFMYGRYGVDSLGKVTIISALILMLISGWADSFILSLVSWVLIIYSYFRMFSRQTYKRSLENQWYLNKTLGIRRWFANQRSIMAQRKTHHIYKCPTCKQKIRIPKGKGHIEIRCPKCHTTFVKNS